MLPPGHAAAGYLVAQGILHITHPQISVTQSEQLLFWGAFFGFCPDLDMFYAFFRARGFTLPSKKINHRAYITHRPFVWLVAGLLVYFLSQDPFWQTFGLVMWLGAWSHFFLDSFKVGVKWLWPITNRYFAFRNPGLREEGPKTSFMGYWMWFLNFYRTTSQITFYLEILILVSAAVVFGLSTKGIF